MNESLKLIRVDRLVISFLVDNSIEWFGKLPPGFKSELRVHAMNGTFPMDKRTGVPIIDLENFCCGAHGFSVLIETTANSHTSTMCFDSGPDSKSIIRNIKALNLDEKVRQTEEFVLSHWHADHSGGLLALLKHRRDLGPEKPIIIDLHPDRPIARGIRPPNGNGTILGRLPDDPELSEIEQAGGTVERHSEAHLVSKGCVFVSGTVPRVTEFEQGIPGAITWVENANESKWIDDCMIMDERYAAVDVVGKGLVIFSACSHAGIVNVVRDALERFSRPIYMIVGGLHLGAPELLDRIPPTVEFLSKTLRPAPTYVLPMHCSGFQTKIALEKAFGDGCLPACSGMVCDIASDTSIDDERLAISWR